jgi:hypothetical protein
VKTGFWKALIPRYARGIRCFRIGTDGHLLFIMRLARRRTPPPPVPDRPRPDPEPQPGSEVLGKPVRFQQIPDDAFKARMLQNGMSEAMAQGALDMWRACNQGLDTAEPRTPDSSTPTTFRQWCEEFLKPRVLSNAA